MTMPPPRSTRTDPLFPSPTLFRSGQGRRIPRAGAAAARATRRLFGRAPRFHAEEDDAVGQPRQGDGAAHAQRYRCRLLYQRRRRSEEHTSELQSLMRISYAVFCLKKKKIPIDDKTLTNIQE